MVTIHPYQPMFDYPSVMDLIKARELTEAWTPFKAPKASFVAVEDHKLIAFMCMRTIEGGMGLIEAAITDPAASSESRNEAMDLLSLRIEQEAKRLELRGILMVTADKNTVLRAARLGGSILDKVVISKYFG